MVLLGVNTNEFKEFKNAVNSLRCPLCDSQLDGNIHPTTASLYCVSDNKEYRVTWRPNQEFPDVEYVNYYYGDYEYTLSVFKNDNGFQSFIDRYNTGAAPRVKASTRKRLFYVNSRMKSFPKPEKEEDFLKKIRLYQVFS